MSDELRDTFFAECFELLDVTAAGLRDICDGESADFEETIGPVFRAVHSIKGGAGAFGFDDLSRFANRFEKTLGEVRGKRIELTPDVMAALLGASDALAARVRADQDGGLPDTEREAVRFAELGAMIGAEDDGAGEDDPAALADFEPMSLDFELGAEASAPPLAIDLELVLGDGDAAGATGGPFRIRIAAHPDLYRRGSDITKLLRALSTLGRMETVCDLSSLPAFDALDPETPLLEWRVVLDEDADEEEVHEIFEFFEDDMEVEIKRGAGEPA